MDWVRTNKMCATHILTWNYNIYWWTNERSWKWRKKRRMTKLYKVKHNCKEKPDIKRHRGIYRRDVLSFGSHQKSPNSYTASMLRNLLFALCLWRLCFCVWCSRKERTRASFIQCCSLCFRNKLHSRTWCPSTHTLTHPTERHSTEHIQHYEKNNKRLKMFLVVCVESVAAIKIQGAAFSIPLKSLANFGIECV